MSRPFFPPGTTGRAERAELARFSGVIIALHAVGWGLVWLAAPRHPVVMGLAGLAYSFGLRHAFDADHIAAIDNTTRKLMGGPRRPLGVGFFFSLGHSTVVLALTVAIAFATRTIAADLPWLRGIGSLVGTTISGVFLYAIGVVNLFVLMDVWRVFRAMRRGEAGTDAASPKRLPGGLATRWFGGVFRVVTRPRHMYLVGLLFGLGFDTATEVGLLTTAGLAAAQALPLSAVISLPIVFAAGMSLVDSADGVLMCGAYGWAFDKPLRKVFYNLTVTGLSVAVALLVGTIELVSLVTDRVFGLHSGVWGAIQALDMQAMGWMMAGLFAFSWVASMAIWRLGRLEDAPPS